MGYCHVKSLFFVKKCGPKKGPILWIMDKSQGNKAISLRIRRGYVLGVSRHRRHPWRWQSSSWHARCRWRHHGWRSQGIPSEHHGSLRRWDLRYAWLHHDEPDGGWRAWWFPGCYHEAPSCDAWRLPFLAPFLLCLYQSCLRLLDTFRRSNHV